MKPCGQCGKLFDDSFFRACPECKPLVTKVTGTRFTKNRILQAYRYVLYLRIGRAVNSIPKEVLLAMMGEEFPFAYSLYVADEDTHFTIMPGDRFHNGNFAVGEVVSHKIPNGKILYKRHLLCTRCGKGRFFSLTKIIAFYCGFKVKYCSRCGDFHSKGGSRDFKPTNISGLKKGSEPKPNSIRSLAKAYNTTKNYIERHGVPRLPFPSLPVGTTQGNYRILKVFWDQKPLYEIQCVKCGAEFECDQSKFPNIFHNCPKELV